MKLQKYPHLAVSASLRLSKWLTNSKHALDVLKEAERVIQAAGDGKQNNDKTVEVKREIALLLIKRRDHDSALQYLGDVQ